MRRALASACVLVCLALPASAGATVDRAEYAAQANPICKTAVERQVSVLMASLDRIDAIDEGRKPLTSRQAGLREARLWARANRIMMSIAFDAWGQVAAIPAPPGDETRVASWIANGWAQFALIKRLNRLSVRLLRTVAVLEESRKAPRQLRSLERKIKALNLSLQALIDEDQELGTPLGATECIAEDLPEAFFGSVLRPSVG